MRPLDGGFDIILLVLRKNRFQIDLKVHDQFHDVIVIETLFEVSHLLFKYFLHAGFIVFLLMLPIIEIYVKFSQIILRIYFILDIVNFFF